MRSGRTAPSTAPARYAVAVITLTLGVIGCSAPPPAPTAPPAPAPPPPTAAPTITPAPIGAPTPEPTAQSSDVENAFLSNVDDLIAEAADLTVTPCDELTDLAQSNPNVVPSMRGFAAALKRIGATQSALNTDAVRASLADLDHSMSQFEGALSLCGIK